MASREENSAHHEVRKPLVDGGLDHGTKEDQWMVYMSTFVAVCGSYEFGCCVGYSSPTQSAIREDLNLSLAQFSMFGAILTFGAMIGAITIGPITDFIGRKGALRFSSVVCVAGWLAIYFSKGALLLDIGRMAKGYGMGAFSYVVPIFVAEIAPKHLRGSLTALNQLMIVAGVSVSFVIGVVAKTGNQKDFEDALQKLRGRDANISQEAEEIQDYIATLDRLPKAKLLDLFERRYSRSLIISVGLMICQQLGGINGVCFYVSNIFEQAGFSSSLGTIIYAVLQVVVTGIGAAIMDKAGRKPLILTSATGLLLGCVLTAISFFLKVHQLSAEAVPILAVTGILVFIGSFSIGMGAVPWVLMSEIFPINIKGQAGSFATLVNWFGAWLCSYTFNFLMSWSSYGTFILYAIINALAILFVIVMVPETKGRTLEQIQASINT
ncbi:putative major facilitator, sugar transporter, major facilitator superfamily [Rosa chinensis]|uniref:Putative major facilitator, sugar transporter, major facilitator superfamily n=1 Tax=Rosa chinensis TaxID=74649 RepID=A0A2P6PWA3_ROSCH|nr:putative major facilitator, sugar transporter, major facilitator superfamily [Rosa chinensis]